MSEVCSVLVVEDNVLVGTVVQETLQSEGYDVDFAVDCASARTALESKSYDLTLCDLMLPDGNGQELLEEWTASLPGMPVIIMTAYGDIATAVSCIKIGAYDFLTKPVEKVLLKQTVRNAVEARELSRRVTVLTELQRRERASDQLEGVVATGDVMRNTVLLARTVAQSDFSCLFVRGESGTGKGLFSRAIHHIGRRSDKPFVEVNCSALPATLVESELFGHKKGAFTDAKEDRSGLFELADGGTLFLDEIGDMDVNLQTKLLKVIEDQTFRPIGGTRDVHVNVAIIAATNQDVEGQVRERRFREDLYYRLNVVPLFLPPLREHPEDIQQLVEHFVLLYSRKFGKKVQGFAPQALEAMRDYTWPRTPQRGGTRLPPLPRRVGAAG
jgi:DNA-binding NtrC family response regulator